MAGHDLIVIGASAGGVEALSTIARGLPAALPAAVVVVLHLPPYGVSVLPEILARAGPLPAAHVRQGEPIRPGRIYVARPDHHVIIRDGVLRLGRGPHENRCRPAVDPLFRSAALAYGPRVVGVVLTGALDDGAAGLATIKQAGGVAVVQDPADAAFPGMPSSALAHIAVDERLPLAALAPALVSLAHQPAGEPKEIPGVAALAREVDVAEFDMQGGHELQTAGTPSAFACPECHGVLFELADGKLVRYRCRVGHAYSVESLAAGQDEAIEAAMWTALRALEEKAALARRLQQHAEGGALRAAAARFAERAAEAEDAAAIFRRVLQEGRGVPAIDATGDRATAGTEANAKAGA